MTSKEKQWKKCKESLEKKISELENSLENYIKSNSSQRKTSNKDNEEKYSYVYVQVHYFIQRTSILPFNNYF